MIRHGGTVGVLILVSLSCEQSQKDRAQLTASSTQAGVEDIATVLSDSGWCAVFPDRWTYRIIPSDTTRRDWLVLKDQSGHFFITVTGVAGDLQVGNVFVKQQLVYWVNSRDFNPITDEYPTVAEAKSEWGTRRGQLAVRLVEKAEKACESGPAGTSPK